MLVARNPNAPAEVLTQLARDPEDGVRSGVAGNRDVSAEALIQLARDPEMRWWVSRNQRHAPAEALIQLARDPDQWVRAEVARRLSDNSIIVAHA